MPIDSVGEGGNKKTSKHQTQVDPSSPRKTSSPKKAKKPDLSDEDSRKPNWVEVGTFCILALTLIAAACAAYEADRLAQLTADLLKDGEVNANRQLRAYVYAKPSTNIGLFNVAAGLIPETGVIMRNGGQTPAHDLNNKIAMVVAPYPLPPSTEFVFQPITDPGAMTYLPPSVDNETGTRVPLGRPLDAGEVSLITEGKTMRIYVYGTIQYRDIFKIPHYVNFCWTYHGAGPKITDAEFCSQHNDAD